jgi:hypothetical protein
MASIDPGIQAILLLLWGAGAVASVAAVLIAAVRIVSNGFSTAAHQGDAPLKRMALISAISLGATVASPVLFAPFALITNLAWPVSVARLESRLVTVGRGSHPLYPRILSAALMFLGVSAILYSTTEVVGIAAARPWDELNKFVGLLVAFVAGLVVLGFNGVVMLCGSLMLPRRWWSRSSGLSSAGQEGPEAGV